MAAIQGAFRDARAYCSGKFNKVPSFHDAKEKTVNFVKDNKQFIFFSSVVLATIVVPNDLNHPFSIKNVVMIALPSVARALYTRVCFFALESYLPEIKLNGEQMKKLYAYSGAFIISKVALGMLSVGFESGMRDGLSIGVFFASLSAFTKFNHYFSRS